MKIEPQTEPRVVRTKIGKWTMNGRIWNDDAPRTAPTIVLVHGLGMSGRYMIPTAERLAAAGRRVLAPDLPGFGESGKPRRALTINELSDALAAWAEATGAGRAIFIGNSFGAQIILDLALRRPQSVSRAVFVAATIDAEARSFTRQVLRLLLDAFREPFSLLFIALGDYLRAGLARGARTLKFALADPVEEKLPRLSVPTLVVCGGRDPISPVRWAERVASLIPDARLCVLPRAAHAVNYSSPDELAREVLKFIEETGAG